MELEIIGFYSRADISYVKEVLIPCHSLSRWTFAGVCFVVFVSSVLYLFVFILVIGISRHVTRLVGSIVIAFTRIEMYRVVYCFCVYCFSICYLCVCCFSVGVVLPM